MKILHYINNLGSGGAEKILTDILPIMKSEGHDVTVLISNNRLNVQIFQNTLLENQILLRSFETSFYNPWQIVRIIKLVNKEKYDIVHSHLFPSQYWLAFASLFFNKRTRLIKTEHSVHNERKNYKFLRPIEQFVYGRFKIIIAISDQVENNLRNWLRKAYEIEVVYNGVNLDQINKLKNEPLDFQLSEKINLLMVGRFDNAAKDQITLINALKLLPENFVLYFAGEGPYLEKVKSFAKDSHIDQRIVFLGMRQDIYSIMSKVDINVLSTNYEGISGVALESLASGKPFIGSDVVGVNNVVPDSSFLFPKKNPEALAEKIIEITKDKSLQIEMVSRSLEFIKRFDTKFMAKQYLDIYVKIFSNE